MRPGERCEEDRARHSVPATRLMCVFLRRAGNWALKREFREWICFHAISSFYLLLFCIFFFFRLAPAQDNTPRVRAVAPFSARVNVLTPSELK